MPQITSPAKIRMVTSLFSRKYFMILLSIIIDFNKNSNKELGAIQQYLHCTQQHEIYYSDKIKSGKIEKEPGCLFGSVVGNNLRINFRLILETHQK